MQRLQQSSWTTTSLPSLWQRQPAQAVRRTSYVPLLKYAGGASTNVGSRCIISDHYSALYFANLLKERQPNGAIRILLPAEIRSLQQVMGVTTVGDNQFTNERRPPSLNSPAFRLSTAQLITLGGCVVLEVEGQVVDCLGQPIHWYRSIFVNGGTDPKRITEIFLEYRDPRALSRVQAEEHYRNAIRSVQWT